MRLWCTGLRSHILYFNAESLVVFTRSKKCAYAHLMVMRILPCGRVPTDIKDQIIDQQIQPSAADKVIIPNFTLDLD